MPVCLRPLNILMYHPPLLRKDGRKLVHLSCIVNGKTVVINICKLQQKRKNVKIGYSKPKYVLSICICGKIHFIYISYIFRILLPQNSFT